MTSPYEPPLNSDYLFVKLLINKQLEPAFREGMATVKDTVFRRRLGWTLLRAGKRIAPSDEDAEHVHYLHLWQMDNPINLWQGQFTVAGDSDYAKLYRGVDREEQDVLRVPAVYSPTKAFGEWPKQFLLLHQLKLAKDWSQVLDWQWTLPVPVGNDAVAPPLFSLSFAFQSVTGVLRNHFHFFESDSIDETPGLTEADAHQKLSSDYDFGALGFPRDPRIDIGPRLRPGNRIGFESAKAVERSHVELYARETYEKP